MGCLDQAAREIRCVYSGFYSYYNGENKMLTRKDPKKYHALHIQPNPVMKQLTIQSEDLKIRKITLYSFSGSEVFNISNNKQQDSILKVDMDKLKPGQYILKILFEDGSILHKQILKL